MCFMKFKLMLLFINIYIIDANYDLFLRSDLHTVGHTQWFYFAVSNTHPPALVKLSEQGVQVPPVRVRFNIVNLTKPDSLFNLGMYLLYLLLLYVRNCSIYWHLLS